MKRFINSLIVLMLLLAMLPAQSAAGSYCFEMVTNNLDSGVGSLRQVLSGVCDIGFDPSLSGATITLDTTLMIGRNVIIDASGLASKVTISGNDLIRVFSVNAGVSVTLSSLIIAHGNAVDEETDLGKYGGGIFNDGGTLMVVNSVLTFNHAYWGGGAIFNRGPGTLSVIDSTLSHNTAGEGGGIYNESSPLTIIRSTLVDNAAQSGNGGGIMNNMGNVTVANSTFTENSATRPAIPAGGSAIMNYGTLLLYNSTLSGNSGAVALMNAESISNMSFYNTIVANTGGGFTDCYNYFGTIVANINNLIEDGWSCSLGADNLKSGDPLLASLADNGGPTQTMALQAGSPAIDAGHDATCTAAPVSGLDQRGKTRPYGDHCDIGAYELRPDISPNTLPPATVGFSYSQQLTALGGTPPYQWSSIGLSGSPFFLYSNTGMLVGENDAANPATPGVISFTAFWIDYVGGSFSKNYSLTVSPALAFSPKALPTGKVGESYSQVITLSGGTAPYTITPDSLPGWLSSITDPSAGTITLSGTPTTHNSYYVQLGATDALGVKGAEAFSLWIGPQRAFTWSPESPYQGDEVTFTRSSEYGLTSISWWRGVTCETYISNGSLAYVTFDETGTYQICMRYWVDSINDFAWDKQSVTVNPELGELKISKVFDPIASEFAGNFAINYDCDDGTDHDGTVDLEAGGTQTITGIPTGTICTVTEPILPTPPTGWSFGTPTYTPADGTVTISETLAEVTVTNTIIPNTQSYDLFLPIIIR